MAEYTQVLPRPGSPRPSSPAWYVAAAALFVLAVGAPTATVITLRTAGNPSNSTATGDGASGAPPQSAGRISTYHVQDGDTLWAIAATHALEPEAIAAVNDLSPPFLLRPGDALEIPAGETDAQLPEAVQHAEAGPGVTAAIRRWGPAYDVDPSLLHAVTWQESRWKLDAVSPRGAVGVAQVLPSTARWVSSELAGTRLDPWALDDNVRLSAIYLAWLIDRFEGDEAAALAAYHQGRTSVLSEGWYPSTARYVREVFDLRWRFAAGG